MRVCRCSIFAMDDGVQQVKTCALCSTHSPPPEGVCIGVKVSVAVLLCQVDKEGGKDQDQKAYVPSSNQLLRGTHTHKETSLTPVSGSGSIFTGHHLLIIPIITFSSCFDSAGSFLLTPTADAPLHHHHHSLIWLPWHNDASTPAKKVCFLAEGCVAHSHLAVSVNDRAQKFPGASAPVHANHAQDLQEAHAPQR